MLGEEKCEKVQSYFGHFLRSGAKNERNRTWRGSSRRNPSNNGGLPLEAAGITDEKTSSEDLKYTSKWRVFVVVSLFRSPLAYSLDLLLWADLLRNLFGAFRVGSVER